MRFLNIFIITILTWSLCFQSFAREDFIPGSRYTSARGSAMGDAFIPVGDDGGSALFYDPSNIARGRGPYLEVFNIAAIPNKDLLNGLGIADAMKLFNLTKLSGFFAEKPGMYPGGGFSLFPNFSTRGFAVGILTQSHLALGNVNGQFRMSGRTEFIPTIGGALRLFSGIIRLGYSLQWVNKSISDVTAPLSSLDTFTIGGDLYSGSGLSHTLGLGITLPIFFLPGVNVVARNVGNTKYAGVSLIPGKSLGAPPDEFTTFDASFTIQPKITHNIWFNIVAEYRDVTNRSQANLMSHLVGGLELSMFDLIKLRGGYRGGYFSAGAGLHRPDSKSEINFSWYTEEVGGCYKCLGETQYMIQLISRTF